MPAKNIAIPALQAQAVLFRKEILQILNSAGSGHPGGSLSAVEILITLYAYQMRHRPEDPQWEDRDRLIISKGHCTPVAFVTLANFGYFPKEELKTYRKLGSRLQGHVHFKCPGIEFNTGSLGHGLSVSNGIALGAKMLKRDLKVYCLLGDGEMQEGSIWEAAMTAAHYKLDNVCGIIDYNKVQENGPVNEIKNLEPLAQRLRSFGWHVIEVDGHSFPELMKAFDRFGSAPGQPTMIVAHTIKGKGVSFMEGQAKWHGKAPANDQLEQALAQLNREKI